MSPQNQVWLPSEKIYIFESHTFISRLHQIAEENQKVRIVFAEEQKHKQKKETFYNFEDVREEIEKRTIKRVGESKNVR